MATGTSPAGDGLHVQVRPPLLAPTGDSLARVVLVHGAMDRSTSFGRVAARLKEWEIITYDRRGYANSSDLGPSEDFGEQVADAVGVLDNRPSVVAGHSYGANVALCAALAAPELVPAVVAFEPPTPWVPGWPSLARASAAGRDPEDAAEAFMRAMVGDRIWEHLPSATRAQRRAEGRTLLCEVEALRAARPYDPAALTVPVIVGWGSDSPPHLRAAAQQLADALPNATPVEVPGSSHGVHLTHPSAFASLIRMAGERAAR